MTLFDKFQKLWMWVTPIIIFLAALIAESPPMIFALSMVGIFFVVGVNQKRPISQILSAIFCVMLGVVSYDQGYFVNAFVNVAFLVPLSIYGFILWRKDSESNEVKVKQLSPKNFKLMLGVTSVLCALGIIVAMATGAELPLLDGLSGVLPVVATVLMVFAYREQWLMWVTLNILQCILWLAATIANPAVAAILVMKCIFLLNSIIGYWNWRDK